MTAKLTPAQVAVLRLLAEPGAYAKYTPYMGWFSPVAYWRVDGSRKTAQVEKLIKMGFLLHNNKHGYDAQATITQSGRDYLAALDGKQ